MNERVVKDLYAAPRYRYRAYVHGEVCADSAGPTPEIALRKARNRYRLRWLGVEWQGMATPEEAKNPLAGQVALNGHRFALWRHVGDSLVHATDRIACWIMLNPSTADANKDDPTMRRVSDFSRRWGYNWVTVGNLWPHRTSKPVELRSWLARRDEFVERATTESESWVADMVERAHMVIVAWGAHGDHNARGTRMLDFLCEQGVEPYALALTKSGAPSHPLRLSSLLEPQPYGELRR